MLTCFVIGQYQQYSQSSERNSLDRNNLSSPAPPERSRQRQSRARRSYGARHTASEPFGENISPAAARRPHSMSYVTTVEDANSRHLQLLRGAVTSKMVASKSALRSLQRVDMNDLADNEKCMCRLLTFDTLCLQLANRLHRLRYLLQRLWRRDSGGCKRVSVAATQM